ncbi:glutamate receptor ionotropic, kainate 5-like [Colletes latitarsis]|uniref:glutamate receptor ionotropic, kainate 5-like n=1 Tax=Colletes latitarsis TaxID=2605962 RepID=UPI0040351CC1
MNVLYLLMLFALTAAETCIRFLKNHEEKKIFHTIPGRVWRWNTFTQDFEEIQAVKLNNTAVCSVKMANNLRGKTIVVATDIMNPYILRDSNDTKVSGFFGDIWTILEETLGFKTIYRKAGSSASQTLMNGQAHALLVATVIYSDTSGYYTYSTPITTISYALFVQSGGTRVSQRWYTNVFSHGLWLSILIYVLVTATTIAGMHYLQKITQSNNAENDYEFSSASFDLIVVLSSLNGQGCQRIPSSWPLRLIVLSHLITGMLLSSGFNSTLTSYLAIRRNSVPVTSLEDALQKRSHSVCVRNDSSAYIHFTEVFKNGSLRGEVKKEWKNLVNNCCPDMRDTSALDSQLCKPGFVYLEVPDVFLPIYRRIQRVCHIVQTPDHYWSMKVAFLHARFSEHRRLIDIYLMRLHSAGLLKYLERKWMPKSVQSSELDQLMFQPVEYAHIHFLLLGLIYMAILSALICVLENIWYKLQTKRTVLQP